MPKGCEVSVVGKLRIYQEVLINSGEWWDGGLKGLSHIGYDGRSSGSFEIENGNVDRMA